MNWRSILKTGDTEWYTPIGTKKVKQFDTLGSAKYMKDKLNAEMPGNQPKWELYTTFGKPMLRRTWPE